MTKAARKITEFNFKSEGAHVALVDKAANLQEVLIMKSAQASEEEIEKVLSKDVTVKMSIMEFLTRYIGIWWEEAEMVAGLLGYSAEDLYSPEEGPMDFISMVQDRMDSVQINKSESTEKFIEKFGEFQSKYLNKNASSSVKGEEIVKTEDETNINKGDKLMSEENKVTPEALEEQINKAAEKIVSERLEALEKSYKEKEETVAKELQVLKAAEEARTNQVYLTKAEAVAKYLGEETDKEALAKSLRKAEADEEMSALMKAFKELQDTVSKDDALEEVGKSVTKDQPTDEETKIEELQKSLMKEQKMTSAAAYVEAARQVRSA